MTSSRRFPQEVIRAKRDAQSLSTDDIAFFVDGLTDGSISDSQIGAFAMAVYLRGMDRAEMGALTRAMSRSGRILTWLGLDRPCLDKHSTGGVGDKVSLLLAPIVAVCGGAVPMISGRALGHTGGTLDKLESIPGYTTTPDPERFRRIVAEVGCAIVGQTNDLVPADRRLYAIRDVTATVESVPLITTSILSKKLAEGIQGLVIDVKYGSGAFMSDIREAHALAQSLVDVAQEAGLPAVALLTDMNQVLGRTAGNALEVRETIRILTGHANDERLEEVTVALASELLVLGALAVDPAEARARARHALVSGAAAERFAQMVVALGGPRDLIDRPEVHLPKAAIMMPVYPETAGVVAEVNVRALGLAIRDLGGGRRKAEDRIDPAVGLDEVAGIGEAVGPDRPLAVVHANALMASSRAVERVREAFRLCEKGPEKGDLVRARVGL